MPNLLYLQLLTQCSKKSILSLLNILFSNPNAPGALDSFLQDLISRSFSILVTLCFVIMFLNWNWTQRSCWGWAVWSPWEQYNSSNVHFTPTR